MQACGLCMPQPVCAAMHCFTADSCFVARPLTRSVCFCAQSIVNVIGMTKMTPPIKDLLPRLTPILKNRHEKVQENCIDLVGRIADRGAEYVPAREWMRICFELLEMLKAHKKGIRWAHVQGPLSNARSVKSWRSMCSWNVRFISMQSCMLRHWPAMSSLQAFILLPAACLADALC